MRLSVIGLKLLAIYDIVLDMKKDLSKIKKAVSNEKPLLYKKYGVTKIGIFGSQVFGDYSKDSDVDVLIDYKKKLSLFDLVEMEDYLSKKVGKKVDLVPKNNLKKYIRNDILSSVVYV